jgi:hypothetical protein
MEVFIGALGNQAGLLSSTEDRAVLKDLHGNNDAERI